MNFCFHYFAVKAIAQTAGFSDADADEMARFSQYLDDFNWKSYIDCKNMPESIKTSDRLDLRVGSIGALLGNFNPAMTGFYNYADMAFLLLERAQKFTVSPFHFIPPTLAGLGRDVRCVPATVGDGSIIGDELAEVREEYLRGDGNPNFILKKIGLKLHTFADSYAHQLFTGYNSWANDVKVVAKTSNIDGADLLQKSQADEKDLKKILNERLNGEAGILPCIGHSWAGHTPDETHVTFSLLYKTSKKSPRETVYTRNNTVEFLKCAKEIFDFLLSLRGKASADSEQWADLSKRLTEAFLFALPERDAEPKLAAHWGRVFQDRGYRFHYSKSEIEASFRLPEAQHYSDDFFELNVFAATELVKFYGKKPRTGWWN